MSLRHAAREEILYAGPDAAAAFARARAMLLAYTFYPPGIVTVPDLPPIAAGVVLRQRIRVGPLRFRGPVRVLDAWDRADACGYRYEALPGHVERGEVTFALTRVGDEVRFRIESDSAPGRWFVALLAPVATAMQARAVEGAFARMRATARCLAH